MITTTVRRDHALMNKVDFHADRLDIAKSALVRDAVLAYIVGFETRALIRQEYDDVLADHSNRIGRIEDYVQLGGARRWDR